MQVNFIEDLIKRANTILTEKNAIYKHLQENCYEESILKLNKEIKVFIENINKLNNKETELNKNIGLIKSDTNGNDLLVIKALLNIIKKLANI